MVAMVIIPYCHITMITLLQANEAMQKQQSSHTAEPFFVLPQWEVRLKYRIRLNTEGFNKVGLQLLI